MRPSVLVIGGLDPSGGAGLQADIQTLTALGCHPLPVATCLTVQDGIRCLRSETVAFDLVAQQIRTLFRSFQISAIKTGALGSIPARQLATLLPDTIPRVVDPVLFAGGGGVLSGTQPLDWHALIRGAEIITPNPDEAQLLSGCVTEDDAAAKLLGIGARHVLITGGDAPTPSVINRLYGPSTARWTLDRLQGRFRGTGCTLASAIAAGLARNESVKTSIEAAQAWVARSLEAANELSEGVRIPERRGVC